MKRKGTFSWHGETIGTESAVHCPGSFQSSQLSPRRMLTIGLYTQMEAARGHLIDICPHPHNAFTNNRFKRRTTCTAGPKLGQVLPFSTLHNLFLIRGGSCWGPSSTFTESALATWNACWSLAALVKIMLNFPGQSDNPQHRPCSNCPEHPASITRPMQTSCIHLESVPKTKQGKNATKQTATRGSRKLRGNLRVFAGNSHFLSCLESRCSMNF